ncbi:MAG: hypothetical protein E6Q98_10880 [Rhodospirillaceae bacterium]|nr:MAG: hypothetical protein E6Q98_10880 [Rhodospirillaceae bacterium]
MASLKRNVGWTLAGNVFYSGCQWAILMVLAKLSSASTVGLFSLALAVTSPVLSLSNCQLRTIQAADARGRFSFPIYFGFRLICTSLALVAIAVIAFYTRNDELGMAVIFAVGLFKAAESISDIVYGFLQKHEHMRIISQSMMIKGTLAICGIAAGQLIFNSLLAGALLIFAGWTLLLLIYDLPQARKLVAREGLSLREGLMPHFSTDQFRQVFTLAIPMALVLMANTLAVNTPRYALAHWAGDAELGYFASIAYLIVALNLVTTAINNTILPRFAVYHMTDTKKFIRLMTVGLAFIWGIGLLAVLVTIFAGPLILRLLYTPAYSGYAPLLVLMMIVGCMLNSSALFGTAVTAAQSYWPQTLNALLFLVVAAGASVILVPRSGAYGAAEALLLASAVQMLAFAMTTIKMCRRMPANGQSSKEPVSEPAAQ